MQPDNIINEITSNWQGVALLLGAIGALIAVIAKQFVPSFTKFLVARSEMHRTRRKEDLDIKEREMALKVLEDTPDSNQAEKAFRFVIRKLERDNRQFRLELEESRQSHLQCVRDRARDAAEMSMVQIKLNTTEASLSNTAKELSEVREELTRIKILTNIPDVEET